MAIAENGGDIPAAKTFTDVMGQLANQMEKLNQRPGVAEQCEESLQ